ncbi:hypothetical protein Tco_0826817 [Tanacetum coccineum]
MGDENPIRTLEDYSKTSHEGYRNTIELPDPNQHLKGFLKLVDSLDLDGENRERTRMENVYPKHGLVSRTYYKKSLIMASIVGFRSKFFMTMSIPSQDEPLTNRPVVSFVTETPKNPGHLVPTTLSIAWKIPNKPLLNTHPRVSMKWEVSGILSSPSKTILVTPTIHHGEVIQTLGGDNPKIIPNRSFNNNPRSFNNQSNLEGLVSNFMASQDVRLSKFEADFKQQQSEMTNKIDTVLKAITDQIVGTLRSDTIKNLKLSTYPFLSARSYPTKGPQFSTQTHGSINAITIHTEQQSACYDDREKKSKEEEGDPKNIHVNPPTPPNPSVTFITEKVLKFNSFFESLGLVPSLSNTELVCTKEEYDDVMFMRLSQRMTILARRNPKQESKKWSILTYF